MRALIIVDVQNDFTTGSLATERGPEVAQKIGAFQNSQQAKSLYKTQVATQDWHIDPGTHFSDNPDYVDTWPVHCRAETEGAEMHPAIDQAAIEAYFHKGDYEAAYSGFEGFADGKPLKQWLEDEQITDLDVVGIATDFCVLATALDGLKNDFKVRVITDFCAPVHEGGGQEALKQMQAAGAELIESAQL